MHWVADFAYIRGVKRYFELGYWAAMLALMSLMLREAMVVNPFFIWFLLAALLSIEWLLRTRLLAAGEPERFVTFVSDRTKISIEIDRIAYIESRDYEVWVVLDERFVRVHRAFIVARAHVASFDARQIVAGGRNIELSRKYRDGALLRLGEK